MGAETIYSQLPDCALCPLGQAGQGSRTLGGGTAIEQVSWRSEAGGSGSWCPRTEHTVRETFLESLLQLVQCWASPSGATTGCPLGPRLRGTRRQFGQAPRGARRVSLQALVHNYPCTCAPVCKTLPPGHAAGHGRHHCPTTPKEETEAQVAGLSQGCPARV